MKRRRSEGFYAATELSTLPSDPFFSTLLTNMLNH